jgi:hypothetical protein
VIVFETAKEAAAYFEELPVVYVNMVKFFNHYLIEGYAKIQDYRQVEYYAQQNIDLLQEGQNSWFKTYEMFAFATLRLGHYEKAAELLQFLKSHELYENQQPILRDNIEFMEAHLFFLFEVQVFKPKCKTFQTYFAKPLRMQHFVNDLEVAAADRQGLAIVHILMEVAVKLIRGEEKNFLERIEAVEKFFQRNTELEGHERLLAFFRLLQLGIKHHWDRKKIDKEGQESFELLASQESVLANQRFDLEYIPYITFFDLIYNNVRK